MSKKLYEVTIEYTYYAYAEDEHEACEHVDAALQEAYISDYTSAVEVPHADWRIEAGWNNGSLVYHDGTEGDLELGKLLKKLPPRGR